MKQFDVVKLKNNNKAIIKRVFSKKEYLVQIINDENKEIQEQKITSKDVEKVLYSKEKRR